jgi:hypothetical protein
MVCDGCNSFCNPHNRLRLCAAQILTIGQTSSVLDESLFPPKRRRLRLPIGSILCGVLLAYLTAAAVIGLLAG